MTLSESVTATEDGLERLQYSPETEAGRLWIHEIPGTLEMKTAAQVRNTEIEHSRGEAQ